MANLTDLGGLFFQLGLIPDKNSFETGYRLIDGTVNKFSMLIGTARNAANVMQSFATDAGKTDSALYKTSMRLGLTAEVLSTWKAAAKIAGVSAEGLVSSIGELDYALNNAWAEGLDKYAQQLSKIGMSMDMLKDKEGKWLSGDKAVKKILEYTIEKYNSADTEEAKKQIGYGLYDAMGAAVYDLFAELIRTGASPDEVLANAKSTQFQTNESMNKGSNFMTEWNTFQENLQSVANLLGDETGGALTKTMQDINQFFKDHKTDIVKWIEQTAKGVQLVAEGTALILTRLLAWGNSEGGKKAKEGLSGMFTEAWGAVTDFTKAAKEGRIDEWAMYDLPYRTGQFFGSVKDLVTAPFTTQKTEDGILRPDGTLTQVAPDDWVFAVRNVGDLARAFIPPSSSVSGGNMELSIVQNFTINGGSDIPQVLKQQAYQGTQDALTLMQQSSTRLQLMSGTR